MSLARRALWPLSWRRGRKRASEHAATRGSRAIVWVLLIVGIGGSVAAAAAWRASVDNQSRRVFDAQAGDVTASIAVSLARVDDLAAAMRTLVGTRPDMTNSEWTEWFAGLDVTHRYPGVLGVAYVQIVPAAELPAFEAKIRADPLPGHSGAEPFTIIPPGDRPSYCFVRLGGLGPQLAALPPGLDLCVLGGENWLSKPRDTGQLQVSPVNLGSRRTAQVVTPIYAGGGVPATVAERRATIIGLGGDLFDFDAVLKIALRPHPGLSVALSRRDLIPTGKGNAPSVASLAATFGRSTGAVVGSIGPSPTSSSFRRTLAVNADGGWQIQISASSGSSNRKALAEGLLVLLIGLVVTALLCTLVRVLTRSRQRAMEMVERRTAELSTSESRFRSMAAASPLGILQIDAGGTFLYGNDRLFQILGAPEAQVRDMGWLDLFAPGHRAELLAALASCANGGSDPVEVRVVASLDPRWVRFSVATLSGGSESGGFVASLEDVSAEVAARIRLTAEARHDPLTGLPNRVCFLAALQGALDEMPAHAGQVAVLFIDLDRFKQVNDAHGHAAGDELLIATAGRIGASLRPGDLLSRLGGDEFAVLMTGIEDVASVTAVIDRLQASVSRPFSISGLHASVGASVGLVLVDDASGDPATILQNADMAMYRAKSGSARFEVFNHSLRENVLARLETEQALRGALERNELELQFQPIVELVSGRITAGEALVRWDHPRRGVLLPDEFLPLAE
ncbi:MAG: hypothetical protein QOJ03_243, partial [Frankiaceae bacterium]|nr:hypothetical protein [Frankiaceae bacterium]